MEIEIGMGKMARRAYGFDEVAIVPSRRTRDPEDVSIQWEIDAYTFPMPMMAAAMDAAVSPATAIEIALPGGARYEQPTEIGAAHFVEHMAFKGTTRIGTTNAATDGGSP